jgi:hypothetical protein
MLVPGDRRRLSSASKCATTATHFPTTGLKVAKTGVFYYYYYYYYYSTSYPDLLKKN